jgi:hypothetical protein
MGLFLGGFLLWLGAAIPVSAQALRYSNHREVAVPPYALVRVGPFYSTMEFSQSVGLRWSRSSGAGTAYLTENRLGEIQEDGMDVPLISTLLFRNYLLLTRHADVDLSLAMTYAQYPMDTQEDTFEVYFPEEAILGNISSSFRLTPVVNGTVFDNFVFKTDYVDTRGIVDLNGGREYRYFNNTVGMDVDWLMNRRMNLGASLAREDHLPFDEEFDEQERASYREDAVYEYEVMGGLVTGLGAAFAQHDYAATNRQDSKEENVFLVLRFGKDLAGGFRLTRATTGRFRLGYGRSQTAGYSQSSTEGDDANDSKQTRDGWTDAVTGEAQITTEMTKTLSHTLRYTRALRRGFNSPVEQVGEFAYDLNWRTANPNFTVFSRVQNVEPVASDEPPYRNWSSGLLARMPTGPLSAFRAGTQYDKRLNNGDAAVASDYPVESQADYDTWTTFIGFSASLMKNLTFDSDLRHIALMSDAGDLDYTRDVAAAKLVYRHQF